MNAYSMNDDFTSLDMSRSYNVSGVARNSTVQGVEGSARTIAKIGLMLTAVASAIPHVQVYSSDFQSSISEVNYSVLHDVASGSGASSAASDLELLEREIRFREFASMLLSDMEPLDSEFAQAIDEEFWDLV